MDALREVAAGAIGSVRTVARDAFKLGAPERMDDATMAHRAIEKTRVEIEIDMPTRLPLASVLCNRKVMEAPVRVRLVHYVDHQILDEARHAVGALALDDHDTLFDALTQPNNLTATSAGIATGLISGCLVPAPGGAIQRQWDKRLLRTTALYTARLERTPLT